MRRLGCRVTPVWVLLTALASCAPAPDVHASKAPAPRPQPKWLRRFIDPARMKVRGTGYGLARSDTSPSGWAMRYSVAGEDQAAAAGELTTTLDRELPAGKYVVWVSVGFDKASRRKGRPTVLEASLGPTAGVLEIDPRPKRPPHARIVIDAAAPFATVGLKVRGAEPSLRIERIYLSDRLYDLDLSRKAFSVDAKNWELIRREVSGEVPDVEHLVEPPNWLANGSFEVGTGGFDWSTEYQKSYTVPPTAWVEPGAAHGRRCLRLKMYPWMSRFKGDDPNVPTTLTLMHRILRLRPGATYHFRGMFRADARVSLRVNVQTAYPTLGKPVKIVAAGLSHLGSKWTPIKLTIPTTANAHGYLLRLVANSTGPATLWVDALTLSAKPVEKFTPAAPVEVGVHWTAPGKVFYVDDPPEFTLLATNAAAGPAAVDLRCRVLDYFDRVVLDRTVRGWDVPAGATESRALRLAGSPTGIFRLLVDGTARTAGADVRLPLQEYVFSVLRKPPAHMKGTFGAYITLAPQPVKIMSRAGIRKTTTLSSSNELLQTWSWMEPKPGQFTWADRRVAMARAHDMRIMANLAFGQGGAALPPKWALVPAGTKGALTVTVNKRKLHFSRAAWERFIEAITRHYKGQIRDWLILDEPYHLMSVEEYAELLKATYAPAKRGNPDCRVIAHGGYYAPWLPGLVKLGAVPHFDGISDYARNEAQGRKLKDFAATHGKFVLGVEYNWYPSMYRHLEAPRSAWNRVWPDWQEATEMWVAKAIRAMCWSGAVDHSWYDARYPGGDMTNLDLNKCLFEYDGTLKPGGTAWAVVAGLFDGFRGVGELKLHPRIETFLLEDGARFAVMCVARDKAIFDTDLALPRGVKAIDFMGNALDTRGREVTLSNAPVYLVGPKAQLPGARKALAAAKLRSPLDVRGRTVLDRKAGRYVLELTLTNRRRRRSRPGMIGLDKWLAADFWSVATLPAIAAGGTITVRIPLNVLAGQKTAERKVPVTLHFDGTVIQREITIFAERKRP